MATRNINLTERYDRFISNAITTGRFANASEAVRAGLALLERQEQRDAIKLEALRKAAQAGFDPLDQGEGRVLEDDGALDAYLDEVEAQLDRGAAG